MTFARHLLFVVAMLVTLVAADSASAQCYGGGWGSDWCGGAGLLGNQFGFGNSGTLYGSGYVPVPPYFAIHPPVYYSGRVFRSYGDSPFAYPPQRPMASSAAMSAYIPPKPELVMNPYVNSGEQVGAVTNDNRVVGNRPRMIVNPYMERPVMTAAFEKQMSRINTTDAN